MFGIDFVYKWWMDIEVIENVVEEKAPSSIGRKIERDIGGVVVSLSGKYCIVFA